MSQKAVSANRPREGADLSTIESGGQKPGEQQESYQARKKREKEEQKKKIEQEELLRRQKEQDRQRELEEIEQFKNQDRLTLELMHSFGCFTGEANTWKENKKNHDINGKNMNDFTQTEIRGHINVFEDKVGIFKNQNGAKSKSYQDK